MDRAELRAALADVAFTTPTPFTADGESLDEGAVEDNAKRLHRAGAELFVPCGNTGEYYALTDEERVRATEITVDAVDGTGDTADGTGDTADGTVVAGAAGSVPEVVSLAERYEAVGADGVMVMHPSHPYKHSVGLEEYYRNLADRSPLPLVVYKRGEDLPASVVATVSTYENVVGVKWANNDTASFSRAVANGGDVTWINGYAERFAPAFAIEGATGFTTGIGNVLPDVPLALDEALSEGEWARARRLRELLRPFEILRSESGEDNDLAAANNVPVVKAGLDMLDGTGGPVRPPLVALSDDASERLEALVDEVRNAPL